MAETEQVLDPRGIGHAYYQIMHKYHERIAQCDAITKEEQTYGELLERCSATAVGMKRHGLKPGDFITICSYNHIDVCAPYFASLFVGAITASADPTMAVSETIFLLNQVEPKVMFVGDDVVEIAEEIVEGLNTKPLIVVFGKSDKYHTFSKFAAPLRVGEKFHIHKPESLDETALVMFSSGSTGTPKGICHSHKSMLSVATDTFTEERLTIGWFSNPYWTGFYTVFNTCLVHGMRKIVFRRFDDDNPWEAFRIKIDSLIVSTNQALSLLTHQKPGDINVENVRYFSFGGNNVSVNQILELRKALPNVMVLYGYGQTELFAPIFTSVGDPRYEPLIEKHPDCLGIFRSDILWKIVDVETEKVLGPHQLGELRVKASFQFKGYHNRDSSDAFDSDGWLKTGDLGYYNEDNGFFFVTRIKESFKYCLHHIIPSEIERVLLTHPSIERAVVLGFPHDMDTNHPMAIVELKKHCDKINETDIVKYVEERVLDKNRLRAGVRIVDKIPLTVTNKVNRFKLRNLFLHNH